MRLLVVAFVLLAAGCESISYYSQAIGGHLQLMRAARPLDDWLADPATPPALRERLQAAQRIRAFASRELALPDNGSYNSYAELDRPYVVWNVFAAAELAVEAKRECFLFAGCVGYRGFFAEEDARTHAARLQAEGYDVHVAGVPAYSTLGWFDDPLLSSFIGTSDAQLARLVFHELAHQVAYARDDTTFNESFAVAVEEEGVRRWLRAQGREAELASFIAAQARRRAFAAGVKETRDRLSAIYRSDASVDEKRQRKRAELERLRLAYPQAVPAQANNAFLVSVGVYTDLVPAFERLLADSGSLPRFYERVRELAASERSSRDPWLAQRR